MARPPLALGHHGPAKVTKDGGQWVARCRVRDLDGVTRRVERWGSSASVWATKIAERREDSTADTYRHWLDRLRSDDEQLVVFDPDCGRYPPARPLHAYGATCCPEG